MMRNRNNNGTFQRVPRIKWTCQGGCGQIKYRTPKEALRTKYCRPCAQKRAIAAMLRAPRTKRGDQYRKNLSESLKRKWRSGTRKANPMESWVRMGNTLRERYARGELSRPKLPKRTLRRIGKKVSKALKGRVTRHTPNSPSEIAAFKKMVRSRPEQQPDENHFRAEVWRIRSPENKVFIFKNLAKFIRDHPWEFLPEDVIDPGNKKHKCHAYSGINSISPRQKKTVGSWKGWTWYSHLESDTHCGRDPLDRTVGTPVFEAT